MAIWWIYTGLIRDTDKYSGQTTSTKDIILLYIFADWYEMLALRRAAIDNFPKQGYIEPGSAGIIHWAYLSLPDSSPLLRYLVVAHAHHWPITAKEAKVDQRA